jgi:peroxiredoxin
MTLWVAGALCFAALAQSCVREKGGGDDVEYVKVGDAVPSFTVYRDAAVSFSPADFADKNSLIVLYWVDCPDCRALMPVIEEVWQQLGGESGYQVLALARDGGADLSSPYCYDDPDRSAYGKFATMWVPRLYVVGPDGRVKWMHTGSEGIGVDGLLDLLGYE